MRTVRFIIFVATFVGLCLHMAIAFGTFRLLDGVIFLVGAGAMAYLASEEL